jgi:hypothetical protein
MHGKIPVADVSMDERIGVIIKINNIRNAEHFPVGTTWKGVPDRGDLNEWWRGRGIPASRAGLREAIEDLGVLSEKELLAKGLGLSLSDQYWIRPKDGALTWEKVNFFENNFSRDVGDVLFARRSKSGEVDLVSPDNTSDGWLRKRWTIRNGKRKLIKAGSPPYRQEPLNEVFTSVLCKRLGVAHVEYKLIPGDNPACICPDFIDSTTELVSAWYICKTMQRKNDVSLYNHLVGCFEEIGVAAMPDRLDKMLTIDYIIANTDRHLNNFGAVRNAETLEWIGPAPIYDSGTSLWHDADADTIKNSRKIESKPFRKNHDDQIKLVRNFSWLDFNSLASIDEEFENILKHNAHIKKERRDALCGALKTRIKNLQGIAMGRSKKHPPDYDYDR